MAEHNKFFELSRIHYSNHTVGNVFDQPRKGGPFSTFHLGFLLTPSGRSDATDAVTVTATLNFKGSFSFEINFGATVVASDTLQLILQKFSGRAPTRTTRKATRVPGILEEQLKCLCKLFYKVPLGTWLSTWAYSGPLCEYDEGS